MNKQIKYNNSRDFEKLFTVYIIILAAMLLMVLTSCSDVTWSVNPPDGYTPAPASATMPPTQVAPVPTEPPQIAPTAPEGEINIDCENSDDCEIALRKCDDESIELKYKESYGDKKDNRDRHQIHFKCKEKRTNHACSNPAPNLQSIKDILVKLPQPEGKLS